MPDSEASAFTKQQKGCLKNIFKDKQILQIVIIQQIQIYTLRTDASVDSDFPPLKSVIICTFRFQCFYFSDNLFCGLYCFYLLFDDSLCFQQFPVLCYFDNVNSIWNINITDG